MKNPFFKEAVDDLFKTAFGHEPAQVLEQLQPGSPAHRALNRGLGIASELPHVAQLPGQAARAVGAIGSKVLAPAGGRLMDSLARGGKALVANHPRMVGAGVGAAALAPILAEGFMATQKKREDELMNAYRDPERDVTASLDTFLEKKAARFVVPNQPVPRMSSAAQAFNTFKDKSVESFSGGVGSGIASALTNAALGSIGSLYGKIRDAVITDPKRRKLVESIMRTDPIVSDAIARNPHGAEMVMEAYGTMVRFAPTLSEDPNAVRSFLREAVIGGAGVNYATIKNLVETEKALHYGGNHGY